MGHGGKVQHTLLRYQSCHFRRVEAAVVMSAPSFFIPRNPFFRHLRNASLAQGDGREHGAPTKSQRTQQPAAAPGFSTPKQSHERATRLPVSPNTDACMSD